MDLNLDIKPYVRASLIHLGFQDDTPLPVFRAVLGGIKDHKEHHPNISHQWLLGDAFNFAKSKSFFTSQGFSRYAAAIEAGYSLERANTAATICRHYKASERRTDLSFQHHESAATLPPNERRAVLQEAAKKSMPTSELRNLVAMKKHLISRGREIDGLDARAAVCPLCDGSGIISRQRA